MASAAAGYIAIAGVRRFCPPVDSPEVWPRSPTVAEFMATWRASPPRNAIPALIRRDSTRVFRSLAASRQAPLVDPGGAATMHDSRAGLNNRWRFAKSVIASRRLAVGGAGRARYAGTRRQDAGGADPLSGPPHAVIQERRKRNALNLIPLAERPASGVLMPPSAAG